MIAWEHPCSQLSENVTVTKPIDSKALCLKFEMVSFSVETGCERKSTVFNSKRGPSTNGTTLPKIVATWTMWLISLAYE